MRTQEQHVRNLPQRAILLQPHQLPGQHHREGQLHDLGGLDHKGQEREVQPCQVAGVARLAKGGFQQQDHAKAKQRQPQPAPLPHQLVDIHQGQQEKQDDADDRAAGLYQYKAQRVHITSGGVDHQDAEGRGDAAKRQQHQIGLPKNIPYQFPRTLHERFLRGCCRGA